MKFKEYALFFVSLIAVVLSFWHQLSFSIVFAGVIWCVLWFAMIVVLNHKLIDIKQIALFSSFFLFAVFYLIRGGSYTNLRDYKYLILLFTYFIVPPLIFKFYRDYCSRKMIAVCVAVFWIIILYTLYRTYPVSIQNLNVIRSATQDEQLKTYLTLLGVMNYALPHAISFTVPGLVATFKIAKPKILKLLCILLVAVVFVMIYFSGSTTAMILSIGGLLISIFFTGKEKPSTLTVKILAVAIAVLIASETNLLGTLLSGSQNLSEGTAFQGKIDDYNSDYEDTQMATRGGLFTRTMDVFFENPIIGSVDKKVGGHNYFFDMLASVGILGFIPLFLYLYSVIKMIYYSFSKRTRFYYLLGISLFIFMGCIKNLWGMEFFMVAFLILPSMLYLLEEPETNQ